MKRSKPRLRMLRPRLAIANTLTAKPLTVDYAKFYHSRKWKALVASIIAERGRRCEDPICATPHGPWAKIDGDHIIELRDGGAPLDRSNVMLRCTSCHLRKGHEARRARYGGQP